MPTTFCVRTRDNRWISQKLSMEKNTIGNEPYIKKATVSGSFFVLRVRAAKNNFDTFMEATGRHYIEAQLWTDGNYLRLWV